MANHSRIASDTDAALTFTLAEEIAAVPLAQLQRAFGDLPAAYSAGAQALAGMVAPALLDFLFGPAARDAIARERELADRLGVAILADGCEGYPQALAETAGRPAALYVRGDPAALAVANRVAIVGTRSATPAGRATAERIAYDLAGAGCAVASGLAFGIDAAAHQGAVDAQGVTIAVLASGVDELTPRGNSRLAHRILDSGGAVVSEQRLGAPVHRSSFPRRNRVISGLCHGVVVVEAPEKSGALSTAARALEQDRQVMAVPGALDSRVARGTNALIREGAHLVRDAADVLESLGLEVQTCARETADGQPEGVSWLLGMLENGPATLDDLAARLCGDKELFGSKEPAELLCGLTELELLGLVRRDGARFVRA